MNISYYQYMLTKEFCTVINDNSDIEVNISSNFVKKQTIKRFQAVKDLFEIGLDINTFMHTEEYNKEKTTPLIEYIFSNSDDYNILKISLEHVGKDFFSQLEYNKQCDIVASLLASNLKAEEKNYLLESLFDKGFLFQQTDINSVELDWIEYGYTDFVNATTKKQPSFNWNHIYKAPYANESITILEKIITSLEDTNMSTESKYQKNKLSSLYQMKEQVETINTYQSLNEKLEEKPNTSSKIKI